MDGLKAVPFGRMTFGSFLDLPLVPLPAVVGAAEKWVVSA
jgi:hypothetical protein